MKNLIESERMFSLLAKDSYKNPEKILPIFQAEITKLSEEFLNLNGQVKVRYKITESGLLFFVEIPATSIRSIFYN